MPARIVFQILAEGLLFLLKCDEGRRMTMAEYLLADGANTARPTGA
jgi:hypothetical protein